MNSISNKYSRPIYLLMGFALAILALALLAGAAPAVFGNDTADAAVANGTPLKIGYLGFSYADTDTEVKDPTSEKPESKLWWNDGFWWGSMFNNVTNAFHIYRLHMSTQTWVDTGVQLDDLRPIAGVGSNTKADTLWDAANSKLYVVSHVYKDNGSDVNNPVNWGRLFRYSYNPILQTYTKDVGFPVTVNEDKTETLVVDKDSSGRLWVTYVSRVPFFDPDPLKPQYKHQVYVNTSLGTTLADDVTWDTPFAVPATVPPAPIPPALPEDGEEIVLNGDISTLVAFEDKIAVMWSNQRTGNLNLSIYNGGDPKLATNWDHQVLTTPPGTSADDHLNLKSLAVSTSGQLFAVTKLSATLDTDPEIVVVARDTDVAGTISIHNVSNKYSNDTRPIVMLDEDAGKLYVFVTGKDSGGKICYKELTITTPLSAMGHFADWDQLTDKGNCGVDFIEDNFYKNTNDVTSMKSTANSATGIVILAADDVQGKYYVHNVLGDPSPVVDAVTPTREEIDVPINGTVSATFSKDMDPATITATSFVVKGPGGVVPGTVTYTPTSKTALFTPSANFLENTLYTVELSDAIKDLGTPVAKSLGEGFKTDPVRETWQFTSGTRVVVPMVMFDIDNYTAIEGETVTVTANLDAVATQAVTVNYTTRDFTAVGGVDYVSKSGPLTFPIGVTSMSFDVVTLDNNVLDGSRNLQVVLSNPVGATLGVPSTSSITIEDNELGIYLPLVIGQ